MIDNASPVWAHHSALTGSGAIGCFEKAFAEWVGADFALGVSNGTVAIEAALRACGIGPGDEVILSTYDWGAGAGAILRLGGIPVFADIHADSVTVSPRSVRALLGRRTRALLVTHVYGYPAPMETLMRLARKAGVYVIEDCAQALGASLAGKSLGTWGDFGCFSLGPRKLIAAGEGGVLVTASRPLFERAVAWTQHPLRQFSETGRISDLDDLGMNGRLHPAAAVAGLEQLPFLRGRLQKRTESAARLNISLRDSKLFQPLKVVDGGVPAYWVYGVTLRARGKKRDAREAPLSRAAALDIPLSRDAVGVPLHMREVFQRREYGAPGWPWTIVGSTRVYREGDFPKAEKRCRETGLVLGTAAFLEEAQEVGRAADGLSSYALTSGEE